MAEKSKKETLLLVDGNALVHRGFHAIPHLSTKGGEVVNGVYGFALLFLKALKELHPEYVVVAFDLPEPTFRDKLYESYKATRMRAPDELYAQIPRVKELVAAFNVPIYEMAGYEADDLVGSLARVAEKKRLQTVILTGDMDTLQLVNDATKVFAPKQGLSETKLYDEAAIKERYGLRPDQLVDYKALRGDPSDNIPGVKGIGEKTATDLLQKFGTLEKVYDSLQDKNQKKIRPRVGEMLEIHRADAFLSQKLAQIVIDLKLDLDLAKAKVANFDEQQVFKLFQILEFRSLLDKLPKSENHAPVLSTTARGHDYHLIETAKQLAELVAALKEQKEFAVDTETTSLNPLQAELVGIGFAWEKGRAYFVPVLMINKELRSCLADEGSPKIGHNIKYDYLVLKRAGIDLAGPLIDTMIGAYLLNPGVRNFDLDSLTFTEFGFRKTTIESLIGTGKQQLSMAEVPLPKVAAYCGEDADYTYRLWQKLAPELKRNTLEKIFFEIEMPLIRVLADMERWGIKIDPIFLQKLSGEAGVEIEKLEKKIWRIAGEEFNIGSPQQLKTILFEKLEIPTQELKKGKTGLSTAATELEKLRGLHPVIEPIFEWRELSKLQNTYLDTLPKLVDKQDQRLHTSFNQTIAATGRLSSSEPNLQNIPIRTELGRQVRKAFIAEPKFKLVAVDYSQIELRLAAHLSGDSKMMEVFRQGGDIHTATAQEIFDLETPEEVTPEMRRQAKTINFGVLYGVSAYGLKSRIPEVSQGEAQDFIDKYFDTYQKLTHYLEQIIAEAKASGFVKNELGRRRYLPEIKSSQFQVRSGAERAAINMPFQSLSADIVKMAMNKLALEGLTNRQDCRLLLQVHDELVFEIEKAKVSVCAPQIAEIMQGIYKLKVPLVVEAKVGDNWGEMAKFSVF